MKIYLVSGDEYDQRYIVGAFTSKELAEKFIKDANAKRRHVDPEFYRLAEEVELDEVQQA